MAPSCVRCSQNHSNPQAFVLTCANCARSWHHRCHLPPVSESELISRIKAFTEGDIENGIHGWRCRRCMKQSVLRPSIPVAPSNELKAISPQPPQDQANVTGHGHSELHVTDFPVFVSSTPPMVEITASTDRNHSFSNLHSDAPITLLKSPASKPVDLTVSDNLKNAESEEAPTQTTLAKVKPNLAPTWMHKRNSETQEIDSWQRSIEKKLGPGRSVSKGKKIRGNHAAAQELFYFSAAAWYVKRKQEAAAS